MDGTCGESTCAPDRPCPAVGALDSGIKVQYLFEERRPRGSEMAVLYFADLS